MPRSGGILARIGSAGVLLHPTSLPGPYGIGDIGPRAIRFLDWATSAGMSVWQVLPLGPTGLGNSPYSALSVFAGSPLLISPEWMVEEGLLEAETLEEVPEFLEGPVDYERAGKWKERMLRAAWDRVHRGREDGARAAREELKAFVESPANAAWLADWTLYASIK